MSPILSWNEISSETLRRDHEVKPTQPGPVLGARALALVHLAMHDAHLWSTAPLIDGVPKPNKKTFLNPAIFSPSGNTGSLRPSNVVTIAARAVLQGLFPTQAYWLLEKARSVMQEPASAQELNVGKSIAHLTLQLAARSSAADDNFYNPAQGKGLHRPDPLNPTQGHYGPHVSEIATLIATHQRFELDPPSMDEQRAAIEKVKRRGASPDIIPAVRTPEETLIGLFWAYDGAKGIGTPPRLYNQVARAIAIDHRLGEDDLASLFALVNITMADVGVFAWREKYRHNIWRPVLGIREADRSMGPWAGVNCLDPNLDLSDPFWKPLGSPRSNSAQGPFTPPFPAYPSGHAAFGAAAFQCIRLVLRDVKRLHFAADACDDISFSFASDEFNGTTFDERSGIRPRHLRRFSSLWQAMIENGMSRVFLGVHWPYDAFASEDINGRDEAVKHPQAIQFKRNVGGIPLGLRVADTLWSSYQNNTHALSDKLAVQLPVTGA